MDNWCRLCAKVDGNDINLFFKMESTSMDVLHLVEKYFSISIQSQDNLPSTICKDCFTLMCDIDRYANQCIRIERMFVELADTELTDFNDINEIRCKYGAKEVSTTSSSRDSISDRQSEEKLIWPVKVKKEYDNKPVSKRLRNRAAKEKKVAPTVEPLISVTVKEEREEIETTSRYIRPPSVIDLNDHDQTFNNHSSDDEELNVRQMDNELKKLVSDEASFPSSSSDSDDDFPKPTKKRQKKIPTEYIDCPECSKVLTSKRSLNTHMRSCHKDKLPFGCTQCSRRYVTELQAALHERSHLPVEERPMFPCPLCKKKFLTTISIQLHIQSVHNSDRSFICEECGKSFTTNHAMKDHMLVHSDEHPCQCRYCPKKFKNDYRLKVHEDTHNNTAYVCPECGLSLNTKRTLRRHMIVHSDVKKYKCQYCDKEYKRAKSLKIHLILHTGMHPYKCPFCDRTFADGSNCRSHKKKAHPEELAAFEAAGGVHQTSLPKLSMLLTQSAVEHKKLNELKEHLEQTTLMQSSSNQMKLDALHAEITQTTVKNIVE